MDVYISLYLFLLGLALGSFALAMVDRMKSNRDWVKGRSECEKCKRKLKIVDLIPVISWLSTRGKCRYCKHQLSPLYPLAELAVGFAFSTSYIFWPYALNNTIVILQFLVWLAVVVILAGLFIFDMRWFLLPNKLIRPLVALGVVWMLLDIANRGFSIRTILSYALAIAASAGVFLVLYAISKGKWIGDGDIRLGVAIGLLTGGPVKAWMTVFIASVLGIIVAIPFLKKTKKKNRIKLKIPFGPVLIIALFITVLFGDRIIDWYLMNVLYL